MKMGNINRPLYAAILSSVVTFFSVTFLNNVVYQSRAEFDQPVITYSYQAQNCTSTVTKTPLHLVNRTPAILEAGKVKVVDYSTFPTYDKTECVTHHAASSETKICIMPTSKDKFISGSLRSSAGWEPHITGAFKRALLDCPDCQVLDFGSNLGVYALIGASANRRVYAVEPMYENLVHLVKSVRLNGWEKRITIITNTLSDVYEEMELWRPRSNAGGSLARKVGSPALDRKLYDGPYDKVSSVQIDNLLEVIEFNKAIMKIDIEGYEPRAMSGASRFFAQMDIPIIFMEWSDKGTNAMALTMAMNFAKLGYQVHDHNMKELAPPSVEGVKSWPFDIIWKKMK